MADVTATIEQFKTMFPNITEDQIRNVLRQKNGNADEALDALLVIADSAPQQPSTSSNSIEGFAMNMFILDPPPPYSACMAKCEQSPRPAPPTPTIPAHSPSSSVRSVQSEQYRRPPSTVMPSPAGTINTPRTRHDETADDERIAILIQNEEFLEYLRQNSTFMREIYGQNYRNQQAVPVPRYRYAHEGYSNYSSPVPNGPVVDVPTSSIPNGPVVDYGCNTSTNWTKRIRSKLPGKKSTPLSDYNTDAAIASAYYAPQDLQSRLKSMSRSSKTMLSSLAKKFSTKKELQYVPHYNAYEKEDLPYTH